MPPNSFSEAVTIYSGNSPHVIPSSSTGIISLNRCGSGSNGGGGGVGSPFNLSTSTMSPPARHAINGGGGNVHVNGTSPPHLLVQSPFIPITNPTTVFTPTGGAVSQVFLDSDFTSLNLQQRKNSNNFTSAVRRSLPNGLVLQSTSVGGSSSNFNGGNTPNNKRQEKPS